MDTLQQIMGVAGLDPDALRPLLSLREGALRGVTLPALEAAQAYDALNRATMHAPYTPLLLGSATQLEAWQELLRARPTRWRAALDEARGMHAALARGVPLGEAMEQDWPAPENEQVRVTLSLERLLEGEAVMTAPVVPTRAPVTGLKPGPLSLLDPVSGAPYEEVIVALVEVEHSWQAPAWLGIGGWGDHPEASTHVALLQHWETTYGARLFACTPRGLELLTTRKPEGWPEAFMLAQAHADYCPGLVREGGVNLMQLAKRLQRTNHWSFWWG